MFKIYGVVTKDGGRRVRQIAELFDVFLVSTINISSTVNEISKSRRITFRNAKYSVKFNAAPVDIFLRPLRTGFRRLAYFLIHVRGLFSGIAMDESNESKGIALVRSTVELLTPKVEEDEKQYREEKNFSG